MPSATVVIPAYNEAATIAAVVQKALAQGLPVIVVDDGSRDDTVGQLEGLDVTVLRNERNLGKAASLWCGMQQAVASGAEAVVTLDGDGQHDPADIPRLLEAAQARPDTIIIAARLENRAAAPRARLFANNFADFWISWAAGHRVRDSQSGYRLYPASLLRSYTPHLGEGRGFVFESEVLIDAARRGLAIHSVAIASHYPVGARASHFHPVRDIGRIVRMVAGKLAVYGFYPLGLWRAMREWRNG